MWNSLKVLSQVYTDVRNQYKDRAEDLHVKKNGNWSVLFPLFTSGKAFQLYACSFSYKGRGPSYAWVGLDLTNWLCGWVLQSSPPAPPIRNTAADFHVPNIFLVIYDSLHRCFPIPPSFRHSSPKAAVFEGHSRSFPYWKMPLQCSGLLLLLSAY